MLDQVIRTLLQNTDETKHTLERGTVLIWLPAYRTLIAERINGLQGGEARIIERFASIAGFKLTDRTYTAARDADEKGLNTWLGMKWTVAPIAGATDETTKANDAQLNMFSME